MQTLPITVGEIAAWLRLISVRGLGLVRVRDLLSAFGLPEAIFEASRAALAHVVGDALARCLQQPSVEEREAHSAQVRATLEWASKPHHHWVTLSDPLYPPALYALSDPPAVLYVEGHLDYVHTPAVAIVGSRYASAQGLAHAEQFGRALAGKGITVVSGLALGIDGAAHSGALAPIEHALSPPNIGDAGSINSKEDNLAHGFGSTVAVMGTGIDILYPARHQALAQRIRTHGALVSEYPLGTPARAQNFPRRNRLIAALSQAVLVVEAAIQSGSLITARLANELGREVLAIPGSIHSPVSKGCHQLIKEGAKLVETVEDIMEELQIELCPSLNRTQGKMLAQTQTAYDALEERLRSVLAALGFDPVSLDVLADRSGLCVATLQVTLLQLELQGWVNVLPGGRVVRLHI